MVGKLKIAKPKDDLSFSSGFEFKDDEYLKALQAYSSFDLKTMMGQKEIVFSNDKTVEKKRKEEEFEYFSCECDVIDGDTMESLSCYNFFNIVYGKYGLKKITLVLNYDTMDIEFDDDVHEWIYNSSFLLKKAVGVFGDEILPKKNFYFELMNDSGEKVVILFENAFLMEKKSNLITIGIQKTKLIE